MVRMMIDQLDGRCMKTFIAVLEEQSFSKAAVRLGYVQSTITAHIKQLEEMTGKQLFRRMPRGVELTEAGREVAPFAYRFMKLGASLDEMLRGMDEPQGTARMRALESFCVSYLPPLLPAFFQQFPNIQLHLETGFHRDITEEVAAHRVDLGIVPQDPQHRALEFHPLVKDELIWVAAPDLADILEQDGAEMMSRQQVIGFGGRCMYQTYANDVLKAKGSSFVPTLEFDSLEMVKQTVRFGMGLALLPVSTVHAELKARTLMVLSSEPAIPLTHGLIVAKERELTAPAKIWRDRLLTHFLS
jgi:DNA-binding transcriptional LysR family regulator